MTEFTANACENVPQKQRIACTCRRLDLRLTHTTYIVAFCAFLVAEPFIRQWGGAVFWGFATISVVYALLTSRPIMIRPLAVFTVIGALYVALSYLDAFPDAWTSLYDRGAIPRQSFYVFLLYPMVLASASLWSYAAESGKTTTFFFWILVASLGLAPLVVGLFTETDFLRAYAGFTTLGLGNTRLMLYVGLAYFLLVRVKDPLLLRFWSLAIAAVMVLTSFSFFGDPQYQNVVTLALLAGLALILPRRRTILAIMLVAVVAYAASISLADRVYQADANTGYRLVVTRDAMKALGQSYGAGVGFGTEVVTGEYDELGFSREERTDSDQLAQGVHNSFAQQFMRVGVLGGSCLIWLFLVVCLPPRQGPLGVRRHLSFLYFVLTLAMMSNVTLESPTYFVGISFVLGYLLVTKDRLLRKTTEDSISGGVPAVSKRDTRRPAGMIASVPTAHSSAVRSTRMGSLP